MNGHWQTIKRHLRTLATIKLPFDQHVYFLGSAKRHRQVAPGNKAEKLETHDFLDITKREKNRINLWGSQTVKRPRHAAPEPQGTKAKVINIDHPNNKYPN